jgi:G:T/U-mismatch repair DNA glycosylase
MFSKIKSVLIFPFSLFVLFALINGCQKQDGTNTSQNTSQMRNSADSQRAADSNRLVQRDSVKTITDSLFDNVKVTAADSMQKNSASKKEMTDELKSKIRKNMNKIFSVYLDIKDELYDNDTTDAQKEARNLMTTIMDSQTDVGIENVGKQWKMTSEKIKSVSDKIQAATTITAQRTLFNQLSESLLAAIKEYGLDGKTVYQLSCSNANSNKGGIWLTDSKNAENPYAGKDSRDLTARTCVKINGAWKYE